MGPELRSLLPAKLTHPRLASEEEEGEPSESAQARALPRQGGREEGRGKIWATGRGCALGCPIPRGDESWLALPAPNLAPRPVGTYGRLFFPATCRLG